MKYQDYGHSACACNVTVQLCGQAWVGIQLCASGLKPTNLIIVRGLLNEHCVAMSAMLKLDLNSEVLALSPTSVNFY